MTDFTASNGVKVSSETQLLTGYRRIVFTTAGGVDTFELSGPYAKALIESLDAEKDHELGRWRWPENPEFVVYMRREDGQAAVFNEITGVTVYRYRGEHEHLEELRRRSGEDVMPHTHAARAYFEAHPERKPWHDAKPWESWVLTVDGREQSVTLDDDREFRDRSAHTCSWMHVSDSRITAGRRIWPEGDAA